MTRDELLPIICVMHLYGGSFVKKLAEAMMLADSENLQKITNTFPELIEKYKKFLPNER